MATHHVPMQGMARIGAKSSTHPECTYVFEPQGVAIPNTAVGICHRPLVLVQFGPSAARK
jgi:hypothetical protein